MWKRNFFHIPDELTFCKFLNMLNFSFVMLSLEPRQSCDYMYNPNARNATFKSSKQKTERNFLQSLTTF